LAHAFEYDSTAVLRGAELLGKHLKLFTDRADIYVNDYTNMTPEDRRRRLMELQQQIQNAERS